MHNSDFYVAAATVIPLLLIAVMATRSLSPGELQRQPISTVLMFGLPVIGEVAAFAYLFFAPKPDAAAAILAIATWAGLLSQLAVALWWLAELIKRYSPAATIAAGQAIEDPAESSASFAETPTAEGSSSMQRFVCPDPQCNHSLLADPKVTQPRCPVHQGLMEPV